MRIAWITDPHLNHVPVDRWDLWMASLVECQPDAILITGDISEDEDVAFELNRLADAFDGPIWFVLGNHDFYGGSIAGVRSRIVATARQSRSLTYLTDSGPLELTPQTWLVGEDGWGDATIGDAVATPVRLNDFVHIADFRNTSLGVRNQLLVDQGRESADRLRNKLNSIPKEASEIVVATHVPPFRESCWYEGRTAGDDWAPFFVCGQVGEVLQACRQERPETKITVLCGHTHNAGTATMADNLVVHTGAAAYGYPEIQGIIDVATLPLVLT